MARSAVGLVKGGASNLSNSFSMKGKGRLSDEEPLIEGWLYRGTSVADLVNRRYAKVFPSGIKTYRKEEAEAQATKGWELERGCTVTELQKKQFMIRDKGVSTVWAMARHLHSKNFLFAFTIKFPQGNTHHKDPFLICLENQELAEQWREAVLQAVGHRGLPTRTSNASASALGDFYAGESPQGSISAPVTPPKARITSELQRTSAGSVPPEPLDLSYSMKETFQHQMEDVWGSSPNTLIESVDQRSSVEHVNGVAVYQEGPSPDGQSGAYLVSAVVAASPRAVFEKLAAFDVNKDRPMPFAWELLQRLDSNARIVKHVMPSNRFARLICAPREIVMQQTWREDEDGTITVLGHSVDHPTARADPSWSWFHPVRVQVESAGFTMAPLQPSYRHGPQSESCLVTFVLRLDLGGWISDDSVAGSLLYPFTKTLARSFIDPALMSVIALRDQVEQSKYVSNSFMPAAEMGTDDQIPSSQSQGKLSELQAAQPRSVMPPPPHDEVEYEDAEPQLGTNLTPEQQPTQNFHQPHLSFSESVDQAKSLATLDSKYWSCPGSAGFHIRGSSYLKDHKKIPAEEPLFSLASVDLVKCTGRASHLAQHLTSIKNTKAPFNFIMNLMLPGSQNLAMVITWAAEQEPVRNEGYTKSSSSREAEHNDSDSEVGLSSFDTVLARFLAGDDNDADVRRNGVFKLIPTIVKGSWVAKQSVGHTPVLLGRKLKTYYHRGPNYFEVDVDVTSSRAANSITGMVQGATSSMIIDMGVVLEGHTDDELPEVLLGTVRIDHLDMKAYALLDNSGEGTDKKTV